MTELSLIRHTAVDVPSGTCYGQSDVPLAATFNREAQRVAVSLQGKYFDKVFTSPLTRCRELAEFCGYSNAINDVRLMEMCFGEWENRAWDSISDPHLQKWFDQWETERTSNGESFLDVQHRAACYIEMVQSLNVEKVLAFTHAGFIRACWVAQNICSVHDAFNRKIEFGEKVVLQIG